MSTAMSLDPSPEFEEFSLVQNPTTTEYAEFELEESTHEEDLTERGLQHEPLLANRDSEEDSTLEDGMESKHYKLPSEGGTIFSSFVS
jgi:hypothetical protein